jgi:non-specific serine/threonine protein kinase
MIPISRPSDPASPPAVSARPTVVEPQRLPSGTAVGSFVLQKLQARDEFGLRYLATASASGGEVTIEEFAPAGISLRDTTGLLRPRSPAHAALWEEGLQAFLQESELLAKPLHPALMRIGAVWQMRGTAYRLWPRVEGRTLAEVCAAMNEAPSEDWLRRLIGPLLDALESLHEAGWVHGNVRPGQILVQPDGTPMLLDTAAVRTAIGMRLPQPPAWPEPGFRPPELAEPPSEHAPGPWSDLYSLAAVVQFCMNAPRLAGSATPQATSASTVGRYAHGFVSVLERSLAADPRERPQSVATFRRQLQALGGGAAAMAREPLVAPDRRGLALSDIPVLEAPFRDREVLWSVSGPGELERDSRPQGMPSKQSMRSDPMMHSASRARPSAPVMPRQRRWPWAVAGVLGALVVAGLATYQLTGYPPARLASTAPTPATLPSAEQELLQRDPSAAGTVAPVAVDAVPLPPPQAAVAPTPPSRPLEPAAVNPGRTTTAAVAPAAAPAPAVTRPERPASAPSAVSAAPPSQAPAAELARREPLPGTPAEACAPRTNFALYRCMQVQCEQSRFYAHAQCVRLRQNDELPG